MSTWSPSSPSSPAMACPQVFLDAYRADLRNMTCPVFLDLVDAQILANFLDVGAEIFRPGLNFPLMLELAVVLNEELLDDLTGYRILANGRHFSVIAPPEEKQDGDYYVQIGGSDAGAFPPQPFVETGPANGSGGFCAVPADGHCLITSLFFMANSRFPTLNEVENLRAIVAVSLTDDQVEYALKEMVQDLLTHVAERPYDKARGCFATWGPRTSQLLLQDPGFRSAWDRALTACLKEQASLLEAVSPSSARGAANPDPKPVRQP